jgi:DNA-binding transcriptional LysR family regulator
MQTSYTIDVGHLRTLRELRERGTVTATAAALHLTPSAVSQQVAALSRSVGAPLLIRHGRRVRLTPQAVILLEHADRVHAELEAARADLAAFEAGRAGTVSVGGFATAITGLVVPALELLTRERPGISLHVEETEPPGCFSRLDTGALDIAVAVDYASGPRRDDPRYFRTALRVDPLLAIVPGTSARAGQESLGISDLAGEPWIAGAVGHPCFDITLAACTAAGVTPRIVHHVDSWDAAIALVACGAGVALIPALALGPQHTGIAVFALHPDAPARSIYAAARSGSQHAPHIAAVLGALAAVSPRDAGETAGRTALPAAPGGATLIRPTQESGSLCR